MEKEQNLTFGGWLRQRRIEFGLTLQAMEGQTGVDLSIINRIEKEQTQALISTAVRICDGLGFTPENLIRVLHGEKELPKDREQTGSGSNSMDVLTLDDVRAFLDLLRKNQLNALHILASLLGVLNHLAAGRQYDTEAFIPGEVGERVMDEAIQLGEKDERGEIIRLPGYPPARLDAGRLMFNHFYLETTTKYPESMDAKTVQGIYRSEGVLITKDIEVYFNAITQDLPKAKKSDNQLATVLGRLKVGSIERARVEDVLLIDDKLGKEGEVLGMFWNLSRFMNEILSRQTEYRGEGNLRLIQSESKIASDIVTISRWLQLLSGKDTSWIVGFRKALDIYTTQLKSVGKTD